MARFYMTLAAYSLEPSYPRCTSNASIYGLPLLDLSFYALQHTKLFWSSFGTGDALFQRVWPRSTVNSGGGMYTSLVSPSVPNALDTALRHVRWRLVLAFPPGRILMVSCLVCFSMEHAN